MFTIANKFFMMLLKLGEKESDYYSSSASSDDKYTIDSEEARKIEERKKAVVMADEEKRSEVSSYPEEIELKESNQITVLDTCNLPVESEKKTTEEIVVKKTTVFPDQFSTTFGPGKSFYYIYLFTIVNFFQYAFLKKIR